MKRKLLLLGGALGLMLLAGVQPSRAILYTCDNYCPNAPVQTVQCRCSGSSPYHPFGTTTCQNWVDYCWHGFPPG